MRKVYSTTAGATFHQETPNYTFCFRKECIEAIIKMSPGEYVIINIDPCQQGGNHLPGTLRKPSFSRLEERPSGSLELILGPRFGHLPSFPLHLLLQNLEGTNFLRIFAAKKWKEDETNKVV